jgi:transposase InsO family protein
MGTGQGWRYLCAVRDGCSRRVIGWAVDEHMHTDLVQAALTMAVAMRGELAEQVILQADRGSTPQHSWRGSPATMTWCARWAAPRCAGTTLRRIILGHAESRVLQPIPMAD